MNPNPRPKAAPSLNRQEEVDDRILSELLRHGASTGAELLAALPDPPQMLIDRTIALTSAGVIRIVMVDGERRFTARRRS